MPEDSVEKKRWSRKNGGALLRLCCVCFSAQSEGEPHFHPHLCCGQNKHSGEKVIKISKKQDGILRIYNIESLMYRKIYGFLLVPVNYVSKCSTTQ